MMNTDDKGEHEVEVIHIKILDKHFKHMNISVITEIKIIETSYTMLHLEYDPMSWMGSQNKVDSKWYLKWPDRYTYSYVLKFMQALIINLYWLNFFYKQLVYKQQYWISSKN